MNGIGSVPAHLRAALSADAPRETREALVREVVDETVGVTFFGEMLKMARNSRLKGKYGHGGRGEDVFGSQLDLELARRAAQKVDTGLSDAIFKRVTRESGDA